MTGAVAGTGNTGAVVCDAKGGPADNGPRALEPVVGNAGEEELMAEGFESNDDFVLSTSRPPRGGPDGAAAKALGLVK